MSEIKSAQKRSFDALKYAISELQMAKPGDRSVVDRAYAVCITDMEKVVAYFDYWINGYSQPKGRE